MVTFEEGKIYTLQEIVDIAREQQRYIDVLEREVSLQATQLEYIDTALRTWRSDSEYSVSYEYI